MKRTLLIIGVVLLVLVLGFFALNSYIYNEKQADDVDPSISSFEECVSAGYPALESYPEQCKTPDGKHFVKKYPESELTEVRSQVTMQGTIVCLPHWNTSGPQTLECAIGFQSDSGSYYTLENSDPDNPFFGNAPMNTDIEITGTLTPGSSERYQSIGTIEVETITSL